ncbi:MAG: hypothetical protein H7Y02_09895, partial [Candidatus Obscuribacterales bacterium]|nr:hypothetical protein [Steroidobacteraceae bacterium]
MPDVTAANVANELARRSACRTHKFTIAETPMVYSWRSSPHLHRIFMRRVLLSSMLLGITAFISTVASAADLKTDDDKTLYSLGYEVSRNLAPFNLTEAELAIVKAGFSDGASSKKAQVETQQFFPKIRELQTARTAQVAAR